jgi:hypothetical protein
MLYSYYCARAPQTRYADYDHVKKQMYKLHAPHRQSGYITDVELRETRDSEGRPDWDMLYTPGPKARAEFRSFKRAGVRKGQLSLPAAAEPAPLPQPPALNEDLVAQLVAHKVSEKKARALVAEKPEAVKLHLRAIPYLPEGQGKKNFAGRLVTAIEKDYELPPALVEDLERARREKESRERNAKAKDCPYCQELKGLRYVHVDGRTSVKRCTHDPAVEERFS